MWKRVAFAVALVVVGGVTVGGLLISVDGPPDEVPDTTFDVSGSPDDGRLIVEHGGGDTLESGTIRVLVYEDRSLLPDRTIHGSTWEVEGPYIQPGDRIVLEDPRFESGQRLVVRWFGPDGQANVHEDLL